MKKIVVLNGSPHLSGRTMTLVNEVLKTIGDKGVEVKRYDLNAMTIKGCQGCSGCKITGMCVVNDDMQQIYPDINDADGIILATPVHFNSMTAQLKLVVDRFYAYLKHDYSSFLPPGKKVLLVATFGGGDRSQYSQFLERTGEGLRFAGFGEYRTLLMGGRGPTEAADDSTILAEAKQMGEWLLGCAD
jgi:multimeric flavodoxin WrbA